jgi:hypothetical protein
VDVTRTVVIGREFPTLLQAVFAQAGLGVYSSDGLAAVLGWVVIAVNLVGLVLAIALAVPRLRTHRTAFWVPLLIGAACLLLTVVLMLAAAIPDPAFVARMSSGAS